MSNLLTREGPLGGAPGPVGYGDVSTDNVVGTADHLVGPIGVEGWDHTAVYRTDSFPPVDSRPTESPMTSDSPLMDSEASPSEPLPQPTSSPVGMTGCPSSMMNQRALAGAER